MIKGLLVIVPCGQAKIWDNGFRGPVAAKDAYTGAPFKVNRDYAESFAEKWVILSAKFGFVEPNFNIPGPYNVTFKDKATVPISFRALRDQIRDQRLAQFRTIVGLGGKDYRHAIEAAFVGSDSTLVFPFAGLRLGEAMARTREAIQMGVPF